MFAKTSYSFFTMIENSPTREYYNWVDALLLWILTNFFGMLGCWFVYKISHSTANDSLELALVIGACAAGGSLLLLPLIPSVFRWVLAPVNRKSLIVRLFTAIAGFWLGAVLVLALITSGLALLAVLMGGWAYLPAAFLAAFVVYYRGIFCLKLD